MDRHLERLSDREIEVLRKISEGSTDREIAQSLYLSVHTVKWHNRQIYAKLGVKSRVKAVAAANERGLLDDEIIPPREKPTISIRHNLPSEVSSFVGRKNEIDQIKNLVKNTRLLTLTGPGGVGKTRLGLHVAAELFTEGVFENGVFFVELAPITKEDLVPDSIIEAIGLVKTSGQPPIQILEEYLADRNTLLILDNYEHLLEAAQLVVNLLSKAPNLKVLCTSREALKLSGEQIFPVPPLALPEVSGESKPVNLDQIESVDLFIQRARSVRPDFDPDEKELVPVAEICIRLDGLPLAIELAAARMDFYKPGDLLFQLGDRFALLTDAPRDAPERHQTMEKAIDWSYQLLREEEKILFNRLSVFQGGRTIEAVEEVCCFDLPLPVLDGLGSLYSKNLIQQEEGLDGELRFIMLETIHEYARKSLIVSGESTDIHRRHAQYFTELVEKGKKSTRGGPNKIHWLNKLETDHDNLRAMYDWAMNNGEEILGLRLVSSLEIFWINAGHYDEAVDWVTSSLDIIRKMPDDVKAGVYASAGWIFSIILDDVEQSKDYCLHALDLYEKLGNKQEMGWMYCCLMSLIGDIPERYVDFYSYYEEAQDLLHEVSDNVGISEAYNLLAEHEKFIGNTTNARKAYQKSITIDTENGDLFGLHVIYGNLAKLHHQEGDYEGAAKLEKKSIELHVSSGFKPYMVGNTLSNLALVTVALGQPRRAAVMLGASDMIFKFYGYVPFEKDRIHRANEETQKQLGDDIYEQAWEEGQAMTPEEAVAYALEE